MWPRHRSVPLNDEVLQLSSPSPTAKRRRARRPLLVRHRQTTLRDVRSMVTNSLSDIDKRPATADDLRALRDRLRVATSMAHSMYATQLSIEKQRQDRATVLAGVEMSQRLLAGVSQAEVAKLKKMRTQVVGFRARQIERLLGERLFRAGITESRRLPTPPFAAVSLMSDAEREFLSSGLERLQTEYVALLKGTPADRAFSDAWLVALPDQHSHTA